jgi:ATP/maltotriose-dependent transcriptional regulator MalT
MRFMPTVIGRERELAALERFLDSGHEELSALLLVGDAGIGKTTVWQEAVRLGEKAGFNILRCRPAQTEAKLGFAALSDLLSSVDEAMLSALPAPQRDAIEAALLRSAPRAAGSGSRAVAAGLLAVLRRLAEESPVVVAIDDVQWLDRPSEVALAFALRRLEPDVPLALLAAQRIDGKAATDPLGFAHLPAGHRERVVLGPLSLSAIYHVIRAQLGVVLPRPTLQRIEEASGGNPLLAIELARALVDAGERPGPGQPLLVPDEIVGLFAKRLAKLPERTRESLLAVALLSDPSVEMVERAVGPRAEASLERALQAELVEIRGDRVRFAHPLIGTVLASSVLPAKRRAMHRRLAEMAASDEERARHLALGSDGPDETVASSLENAAALAERRGASEDAAELLELALELTPDDIDAARRRRFGLARALGRAGDHVEATQLLDGLLREETTGPLRARALELRAQIHWVSGTVNEAESCLAEALHHAGDDEWLRGRVLVTLARVTMDAALCRDRSVAALDYLESLGEPDPGLLSEALVPLAGTEYGLGNGIPQDVVDRGLELERIAPPANVADRMSAALGTWLKYSGDFDEARRWLEATHQAALDEGDEGSLPYALSHLPQLELWTGNWARAEALALEHLDLAETTGQENERLTAIYSLALVHAHMGRVDEAGERIEQALPYAERGDPWNVYQLLSVRGFVELSAGAAAEAVTSLSRAYGIYEASGAGDTPSVFENYPEALVLVGDHATAEQVIGLYERRARRAGKALALAPAFRCRALLLGALGRLDEAVASLEQALAQHQRVDMPFSLARTQLVHGQILRRRGERRAARAALERAIASFDELGSPPWAAKARAELDRVPGRRGSGDALTATEARVAELVAQGKSNEEVAQELFVSKKTVEANLTRIYRKLGVHSRVALAARSSPRDTGGEAAKV